MAVGVAGQVENLPAVDFVARGEQFGVGHEAHQPGEGAGLRLESLHLRLGSAVDAEVLRHRAGLPPLAPGPDALRVVVRALVDRRSGELRDIAGRPNVIRVEVRDHDAPHRTGELAQIALPPDTRVR